MRIYQVVLIALTGLVIAAIAAFLLYGGDKSGGRGIAQIGGPFELVDQDGATRTDADFRGKYMLVYFGYTFCPDVCPTALQVMSQAMDRLDPALQAAIVPIFVTVDPERDTVAQMKSYVGNFHPRMVGLTGSLEQVTDAARRYRVYFAKAKSDSASDYLVDHSSIVFVMDPDGKYLTHFTHEATPEKMAEKLRMVVGS